MSTSAPTTYRFLVAYNGARFKGWQRGNGRTVQATVEEAVTAALGEVDARAGAALGGETIRVDGAGRTDAGAHAEGQVASVVLPLRVEPGHLLAAINAALPGDVAVLEVSEADDRFHARYRATAKTYRYRIVDGPVANPFLARLSWRRHGRLDIDTMRAAARPFVGRNDFAAFSPDKSKKSKERTVRSITIDRTTYAGAPVMEITVTGDGFLWKQVRTMVAALDAVGCRDADAGLIGSMLSTGDRSLAPPAAPAAGLTLVSVEYGEP